MESVFPCFNLYQCDSHFNFCLPRISFRTTPIKTLFTQIYFIFSPCHSLTVAFFFCCCCCCSVSRSKHEHKHRLVTQSKWKIRFNSTATLIKLNYPLICYPQNLRHLKSLSIADMDEIPMDLLHSFDQLKVLNVSGNHFLNTSLALLDSVSSLEVSANVKLFHFSLCKQVISVHSIGKCNDVGNGLGKTSPPPPPPKLHAIAFQHRSVFVCRNHDRMRKLHFIRCVHTEIKLAALV